MEMGAFILSKNVLLAELSEGALIRRNTVIINLLLITYFEIPKKKQSLKIKQFSTCRFNRKQTIRAFLYFALCLVVIFLNLQLRNQIVCYVLLIRILPHHYSK